MKNFFKNYFLTFSILTLVVVYLGLNLFNASRFHFPEISIRPTLQIKLSEKPTKEIPLWSGLSFKRVSDFSSRQLSTLGNLIRFQVFSDVREDIIIGEKTPFKRMYLKEEVFFQYPLSKEWVQTHYLDLLTPFMDKIQKSGATILSVAVPTKISIERRVIRKPLPPPYHPVLEHPSSDTSNLKENAALNYDLLAQGDSRILALYSALKNAQERNPEKNIFRPMDTHWSSLGIAFAAKAVLERLAPQKSPMVASLNRELPPNFEMDFFRLLGLNSTILSASKAYTYREPLYGIQADESDAPKPTKTGRLFLIGSSYSQVLQETPYSFGKLLAKALGKQLIQETDTGDKMARPALKRLQEKNYKLNSNDVVIFEFPFRFPWSDSDPLPVF